MTRLDAARVVASVRRVFEAADADTGPIFDALCREVSEALGEPVLLRLVGETATTGHTAGIWTDDPRLRQMLAGVGAMPNRTPGDDTVEDVKLASSEALLRYPALAALGVQDVVVAPLRARGRTIGALMVLLGHLGGLEPAEQQFLTDVVDRAALLVDCAGLLTQLRTELEERTRAERRQRAVLNHALDVVMVFDAAGKLAEISPGAARLTDHPLEELIGLELAGVGALFGAEADAITAGFDVARTAPGQGRPTTFELRRPDGTRRWVETITNNLLDDPTVQGMVVTARDVTERRRNAELVQAENDVLAMIVNGEPLSTVLEAMCRLMERVLPGASASAWTREDEHFELLRRPGMAQELYGAEDGPVRFRWEDTNAVQLGEIVVDSVATQPGWAALRDRAQSLGIGASWSRGLIEADDTVLGLLVLFVPDDRPPREDERQVIDLVARLGTMAIQRTRASAELSLAATCDPLTGLPNRAVFLARVGQALSAGRQRVAVLFVDLDHFKTVNDTSGHAAGDGVLQQAAARLSASVRPGDTVARLGGDEFAVLCLDVDDTDIAVALAGRVLAALVEPFEVGHRTFHISASIGIAAGGPGGRPETFLRDADAAMYRAKAGGRGRCATFTPEIRLATVRRHSLEMALRHALEHEELTVAYQPVVGLCDGAILGVEALVRWHSRHQGTVPPATFIPVAEHAGLIGLLGNQVLDQAVAQAATWRRDGLTPAGFSVAVNVSVHQLTDPGFVPSVLDCLDRHHVSPDELILEVTESAVMADIDQARAVMLAMASHGVTFAIDDFGTGHSSLARLRSIEASILKLDRSFVADLDQPTGVDLVAGVIGLAHALGKTIIAEGVETADELVTLRQLGADALQGYHLARPMPAAELTALLAERPRW